MFVHMSICLWRLIIIIFGISSISLLPHSPYSSFPFLIPIAIVLFAFYVPRLPSISMLVRRVLHRLRP